VTFDVTALDAVGQTATSYAGTASFTSSDAQAQLPANATFTAGQATGVSIEFRTAGPQSVTATDTATDKIRGYVYGLALRYDFGGGKYSAYSTYLRNGRVEDFVIGTAFALKGDMFLDMSYKRLKGSTDSTTVMKGFGAAGVGIRL